MRLTGQQEGGLWLMAIGGPITVVLGLIWTDWKAVAVGIGVGLVGGGLLWLTRKSR